MPQVNERVVYRAIAGDDWDAIVIRSEDRRVDISIMGPGQKKPFELHAVRWFDDSDEPHPNSARPQKPEHVCWCGEKYYPPKSEADDLCPPEDPELRR